MEITPNAIQDLLDELEASKRSRLPRLECFAETPFGSLRGWKRCDSATGPENLRFRGRNLGTRFDENFPD